MAAPPRAKTFHPRRRPPVRPLHTRETCSISRACAPNPCLNLCLRLISSVQFHRASAVSVPGKEHLLIETGRLWLLAADDNPKKICIRPPLVDLSHKLTYSKYTHTQLVSCTLARTQKKTHRPWRHCRPALLRRCYTTKASFFHMTCHSFDGAFAVVRQKPVAPALCFLHMSRVERRVAIIITM